MLPLLQVFQSDAQIKFNICMLSSENIVLELKAKKENLERIVHDFEYLT